MTTVTTTAAATATTWTSDRKIQRFEERGDLRVASFVLGARHETATCAQHAPCDRRDAQFAAAPSARADHGFAPTAPGTECALKVSMRRPFDPSAHVFQMSSLEGDWLTEVTIPDFDATTLDAKTAEAEPLFVDLDPSPRR
jgi:hypothetical protein